MNQYDQAADDLGIPAEPMRRLPAIVLLVRDVTTDSPSEWGVKSETRNLRSYGFVITDVRTEFDPYCGFVTDYWGYDRNYA